MKNGKATGPENIPVEIIKALDNKGIDLTTKLLNAIYNSGTIPEDLCKSVFILLPETPGATESNLTQQWLQRYGWEILPHPVHSPDLAPSDFHLFGPLKRHLGGMAFETEDDLISELRNWFDNLDVDFFRVGINSLLSRWQKCIDLHRDYVEK
ncbi:histone-lysine N-methyltransferase SETMAR [Plakobranchus ocellatus]|uniref:Histone-lysine N-methyltransferase SETMAR n=1 Tax=Plakobranchus ocellatus TaxID=259542 RepID=A0AAV4D4G7_9GAST|nr:histone-lysine N-methyltransferase SETMAR [Plakobranchus ocellatus]